MKIGKQLNQMKVSGRRQAGNCSQNLCRNFTSLPKTSKQTLKHFQFRTISQRNEEVFTAFCSRVEKEAKSCNFKCEDANCTVEETVIRDQIIIGTHNEKIQQDALKDSWDLKTLRTKGMQIESAERGASELTKDN